MPALPGPVDAALEGWWRLPPRLRLLAGAGLVGLVLFGIGARTAASPHGPLVAVPVAQTDATAGDPVAAADVVVQRRPAAFVPDGALDDVPQGRLARDVGDGEVVTDRHVVDDVDDLLASGEVALALAQHLPSLPARADLVVLGTALDGTGRMLATARLLAAGPEWTWIALPVEAAPDVAAGMATGGITVVVAPAG